MQLPEALLVARLFVPALGNAAAGRAQANSLEYQAQMARQAAARERQIVAREAKDFEKEQRKLLTRRRALNTGLQRGTGSDLLVETAFENEIGEGVKRILEGGQVSSTKLENQSRLARMKAGATRSSSYSRAGMTLLTGLSEMSKKRG